MHKTTNISEQSPITPFEVYAIRYAFHDHRSPSENYLGHVDIHDSDTNLDYFIWVVKRNDEIYVIDTGFDTESAKQRGRTLLLRAPEGLDLLGIDAKEVKDVIITHLHYDHAGTLGEFPKATFHIQEAESSYATGKNMCHNILRAPFYVEDIVSFIRTLYAGRVKFYNGSAVLSEGLSIHLVGGHTAGLQIVRVWTKRGWVVLASDATHLYGNIANGIPFPAVYNVGDMMDGYQTVKDLADSENHIIPGHDPLVMKYYSSPTKELEGKVVRLDEEPKNL